MKKQFTLRCAPNKYIFTCACCGTSLWEDYHFQMKSDGRVKRTICLGCGNGLLSKVKLRWDYDLDVTAEVNL